MMAERFIAVHNRQMADYLQDMLRHDDRSAVADALAEPLSEDARECVEYLAGRLDDCMRTIASQAADIEELETEAMMRRWRY